MNTKTILFGIELGEETAEGKIYSEELSLYQKYYANNNRRRNNISTEENYSNGKKSETDDEIFLDNTINTQKKFISFQKWKGVIESIDRVNKKVTAQLFDITEPTTDETAIMNYDLFSEKDQIEKLKEGNVFYWNVGKETSSRGQVSYKSIINFQRLPAIDEGRKNDLILDYYLKMKTLFNEK